MVPFTEAVRVLELPGLRVLLNFFDDPKSEIFTSFCLQNQKIKTAMSNEIIHEPVKKNILWLDITMNNIVLM
jgi:hypothetical protein